MNCFAHARVAAVGMCVVCQKGVCHDCAAPDTPRVVCTACVARGRGGLSPWLCSSPWYGLYAYEYKSSASLGGWPLVHMASGIDPVTLRPRIASGVVAIGNVAVGIVAIGGLACGLVSVGGASLGLLLAVGGAALGLGVSVGGLAVGTIAIGGVALGSLVSVGGMGVMRMTR